jgi:hypothetical protein
MARHTLEPAARVTKEGKEAMSKSNATTGRTAGK